MCAACFLAPSRSDLQAEIDAIDLASPEFASLRASAIVDMHTHHFNARYLPLRNILLGKRDKYVWTGIVSDPVAIAIAELIVAASHSETQDAPVAITASEIESRFSAILSSVANETATPRAILEVDPIVVAVREALRSVTQPDGAESELVAPRSWSEETRDVLSIFRPYDDPGFLSLLLARAGPRDEIYRKSFAIPDERSVFVVSHMMDLAPVFGQQPDGKKLLDFDTQIARTSKFHPSSKDGFVYFVAYCPFRDNHPHGSALSIIRDAVMNHGAYGVKIYPPSGYRPFDNEIPERPKWKLSPAPGEQWDSRYRGIENEALDSRLACLLEWCATNEIPALAHCHYNEFEPRKGYSEKMADPRYWEEYLKNSKCDRKLRLCLGHAGGPDYWFGDGCHQDWGETVVRLCRTYENVYCELGILDGITDSAQRAYFVELLAKLFAEEPSKEMPYRFRDKVMYGTDWYMPVSGKVSEYLAGYERAFLHPKLRPYYRAFFRDNALRFLDAEKRQDDRRLSEAVRERLKALLETRSD